MGLIREVKQSIFGKKILYLIIYIQLVMVFFATINAGIRIAYTTDYLTKIRNVVDPNWVKPKIADIVKQGELRDKPELVDELYNFFLNHSNVTKVGGIGENIESSINPGMEDLLISNPSKLITTVFVEEFFLENLGKKIRSGRNLKSEDYNEDIEYMPVLVSYNLRNKYKIGSIVGDMYKVVGVLKRNVSMPMAFIMDLETFGTIDSNFIVTPKLPSNFEDFPEDFPQDYLQDLKNMDKYNNRFEVIYIELKDEKSIESFAEDVMNKGNEIGVPIEIESLHKTSQERVRKDLPRAIPTIFVAGITVVLAIIGQIAVNLSLLLRKKREFGIRLACGASLVSICRVVIVEMLMLILMAVATGYAILLAIDQKLNPHLHISEIINRISPTAHTITFVTAAIIFLVVSIVPILRIRKMEPTELIREV